MVRYILFMDPHIKSAIQWISRTSDQDYGYLTQKFPAKTH